MTESEFNAIRKLKDSFTDYAQMEWKSEPVVAGLWSQQWAKQYDASIFDKYQEIYKGKLWADPVWRSDKVSIGSPFQIGDRVRIADGFEREGEYGIFKGRMLDDGDSALVDFEVGPERWVALDALKYAPYSTDEKIENVISEFAYLSDRYIPDNEAAMLDALIRDLIGV